jgi:type I restriction enzyme S subunit
MGDWKEIIVGSSAEILAGYAFDSKQFVDKSKGIPLIRIRDLKRGHTEVNYVGKFQDRYIIEEDDVLIGMDGDFHVVRWKGIRALLNQRVLKVTAKGGLDNNLLYYFLVGELIKIQNQITGTTVKHLSNSDVAEIRINVPEDIIEQYTIANILTTIDQVIEKTEQLIAKYERIKTGLMQDLLTRGIDEQGNIRSEETHEFKDSPLGRIPVEWEVVNSNSFCVSIADGTHDTPKPVEFGVPFYTSKNLTPFNQLDNRDFYNISYEDARLINKRSFIEQYDILFGLIGTIGNPVIVKEENPKFSVKNVGIFRFNKDEGRSFWMYLFLNSEYFKKCLGNSKLGSTQSFLGLSQIRSFYMVYPKIEEMEQIKHIFHQVENSIEKEKSILIKNLSLKTALMQDLLTGKVRVDALMNQAQETI